MMINLGGAPSAKTMHRTMGAQWCASVRWLAILVVEALTLVMVTMAAILEEWKP